MSMNILDAAYHVVHDYPGGAHSLGPRMGKNPNTLNHEVAGDGTAKFGLADAVKASQMARDYRILHAFAEECGHMCVPLPTLEGTANCALEALAKTSQQFATLCTEVCSSTADGVISDNELQAVERARADLLTRLAHLGHTIRQLNAEQKPQWAQQKG